MTPPKVFSRCASFAVAILGAGAGAKESADRDSPRGED